MNRGSREMRGGGGKVVSMYYVHVGNYLRTNFNNRGNHNKLLSVKKVKKLEDIFPPHAGPGTLGISNQLLLTLQGCVQVL